jgi:hypothetical protein
MNDCDKNNAVKKKSKRDLLGILALYIGFDFVHYENTKNDQVFTQTILAFSLIFDLPLFFSGIIYPFNPNVKA